MSPSTEIHASPIAERSVVVETARVALEGDLAIPDGATGLVVFAHGSGSSRHSSRNRYVAQELRSGNLGTLLIDLLTPDEEAVDAHTRQLRFDIVMLADRLLGTIQWLQNREDTRHLRVGLFGASTGGGAALIAAACNPELVRAVVSRGGRPDLAGAELARVLAPTLLIVGGRDDAVIDLNKQAMRHMTAPVKLAVVPGATHLFEESGTLEQVASLARDWFVHHLNDNEMNGNENSPPRR